MLRQGLAAKVLLISTLLRAFIVLRESFSGARFIVVSGSFILIQDLLLINFFDLLTINLTFFVIALFLIAFILTIFLINFLFVLNV